MKPRKYMGIAKDVRWREETRSEWRATETIPITRNCLSFRLDVEDARGKPTGDLIPVQICAARIAESALREGDKVVVNGMMDRQGMLMVKTIFVDTTKTTIQPNTAWQRPYTNSALGFFQFLWAAIVLGGIGWVIIKVMEAMNR